MKPRTVGLLLLLSGLLFLPALGDAPLAQEEGGGVPVASSAAMMPPGSLYLFSAFVLTWAVVWIYLMVLHRSLRRLERMLKRLEREAGVPRDS